MAQILDRLDDKWKPVSVRFIPVCDPDRQSQWNRSQKCDRDEKM